MRRAVVTGASGFIGRALTERLLAEGWTVYAVVRDASRLPGGQGLHVIEAAMAEYGRLDTLCQERGFDAFFHLAWDGTFGESFRDYHRQMKNAAYAGDALQAAVRLGAKRFIYVGTIVELEAKHYMVTDGGEPRVSCIYGTAKAAGEMLCRRGECPKLVSGENLYDWIYVGDVAAALTAIADRGKGNTTYYVGHRQLQTFEELVSRTRDIVAPGVELRFGTLEDRTATDWTLIDRGALYRDTGFECTADVAESVRKTARWLAQEDEEAMEKRVKTTDVRGVTPSST